MGNYIIDRTNPDNVPIEVAPAGKKTQAGITWKGKYYAPWGEALNENLLKLTENFASIHEPSLFDDSDVSFNRLDGQLWYHTRDPHHVNSKILKIQDGNLETNTNGWKRLELIISDTEPSSHTLGEQWYDIRDNTISISRSNGVFDDLTVKKALDSALLEGIRGTQFLRNDIENTMYATLELSDIIPRENDTFVIGSENLRWASIDVEIIRNTKTESLYPLTIDSDIGRTGENYRNLFVNNIQTSINHYGDLRYTFPTTNGYTPAIKYSTSNSNKTFSIHGNVNNNNHNIYFKVQSSNINDGFIFQSNTGKDILLVRQGNILVKETDLIIKTNLKLESVSSISGCNIVYNETTQSIEFIFYD